MAADVNVPPGDLRRPMSATPDVRLRLALPAEARAVRDALQEVAAALVQAGVARDEVAIAELVLAEALNNIVEHAFQGDTGLGTAGWIEMTVIAAPGELACEIRDDGRPMPGGHLPVGRPPRCSTGLAALPEGGFGWHLIRSLARDLSYARDGTANRLTLRIPLEPSP